MAPQQASWCLVAQQQHVQLITLVSCSTSHLKLCHDVTTCMCVPCVHVCSAGVLGRSQPVLNFCANNYLGLSNHPEVVAAARQALDTHGFGLSSVRFICGTQVSTFAASRALVGHLLLITIYLPCTTYPDNRALLCPAYSLPSELGMLVCLCMNQ